MAVFNEPTQWDHTLGNNADTSTLPDDAAATAGIASLQKLFQIINATPLEAGGIAPDREDVNALFKYLGDQIFYTQNGGIPSYNAAYDYIPGRVVLYTDNNLYKCIQANGASSTVVAPGTDEAYWKQLDGEDNSTSLIPNQLIVSPIPLTDANLHLLDGALLSGSGVYADYVDLMQALYESDPTLECFTDEATWQASVTAYGVCGKFVWDSVNDTLRLPKITGFIEGTNTASELGSLVEAGAPDATGYFGNESTGLFNGANGVFEGLNGPGGPGSGGAGIYKGANFALSNSNSIYGNSNTIQPQAIKQYFYIVVGTISKTEIQIDIDNYIADLALKADTDLSNAVPNQAFINSSINWGMPDYSAGVSLAQTVATEQTFTMTDDGYLAYIFYSTGTSNVGYIKVNDITILSGGAYNSSAGNTFTGLLPVNKNDVIKFKSTSLGSEYLKLDFYPCKGV